MSWVALDLTWEAGLSKLGGDLDFDVRVSSGMVPPTAEVS